MAGDDEDRSFKNNNYAIVDIHEKSILISVEKKSKLKTKRLNCVRNEFVEESSKKGE